MGSFVPRLLALTVVWLLATTALTYAAAQRIHTVHPAAATTTSAAASTTETLVVPDVRRQPYVFAKGTLGDSGFAWRVEGSVQGFAANTSEQPTCGSAWTTEPGNSSQPPAGTLPSFMGVIVSTRISQSGSTISGDVSRIIVVTPNAGYGPNPGQHGTGTVVATYCTKGGYL